MSIKKVTKAVIPAAGLGTRMLPIAMGTPKEMLPIVDKPAMQYLVEEAVNAGITDILIITGRGKETVESYFDFNPEYEKRLADTGKLKELEDIRGIANLANIFFIRQKEAKGLGHAVSCARQFVGDEPFAVLYGDDVVVSETPAIKQLIDVYEEYGLGVAGVKYVTEEQIQRYCSLKVEPVKENIFKVFDMIEKPSKDKIFSLLSILGRVVLPPEIFDILDETPKGAGGEIQLTDAMRTLTLQKGMMACEFEGTRYDIGSKLGFLIANVEQGLLHSETGDAFKEFLKGLNL